MTDTVSGQQANDDITMTKKEHDELQAKVRLADKTDKDTKAKAKLAKADADRKTAEERLKAAQDAGIGKELRESEAARDTAQGKLQRVLTDNAIRDAAGSREWSASAQRSAAKMVDSSSLERDDEGVPTADSVKTALDGLEGEYPDIYVSGGLSDDGDKGGKKKAVTTPANPSTKDKTPHFDGFISQQEFVDTPFEARQTPEFRERLDRSMKVWPDTFNHKDL